MSDEINKKISVEIEIADTGQQRIVQYKTAFDSLRSSVNNLSSPLSSLDKSVSKLNDSITKLNIQNKESADSINKVGNKIKEVSETWEALKNVTELVKKGLEGLKEGFVGLEAAATAGLSVLISFLPEIIDWVSDLFNADTTTKSLNQTLKEHKTALDAIRQARQQGAQDAQDELTRLKLLYNASQDHNLSLKERQKAVASLQQQYPGYFSNLTQETILAGKAAGQYDTLTKPCCLKFPNFGLLCL